MDDIKKIAPQMVAVAVVLVIVAVLWKNIAAYAAKKKSLSEVKDQLSTLPKAEKTRYLTQNELNDLADRIYNAFSWTGDDEDAIYSAFDEFVQKQGNTSDFLVLKSTYTLRHDDNLFNDLSDNLNDDELNQVRSILMNSNIDKNQISF